ncbi:serine carboxypeptidase s28 domain-containing protein [Ditylenchus destructor]|uniref:Serine carboxypeptidase s28 domain-containing protein n=1 Tax=Ditylenchus destructor TaxID=166010 RepID=A0AAD4R3Z4_9BILA|nr:serine carboxypeptidase s28 domain-containing protein [Ditylenchus destructor]
MAVFKSESSALFLFIGFCLLGISTALEAKDGKMIETSDEIPIDKGDTASLKFKLRYYYNNVNYKEGGPLFLYLGGQQKLEDIDSEEVRVVEELANKFEGRFVALEHRFYGDSTIVPKTDTANFATQFTDLTKLAQLDLNKVLDDIEAVLPKLSKDMKPMAPLFLFGTGYSGLVAMLYNLRHANTDKAPNGTWISSAPLREFVEFDKLNTAHESRYDSELTTLFTSDTFGCKYTAISQAFTAIDNYLSVGDTTETTSDADKAKKTALLTNLVGSNVARASDLNTNVAEKGKILKVNIVQLIRDLAAHNFPFDHQARIHQKSRNIPASPVKKFCDKLKTDATNDEGRIKNLREGLVAALSLELDSTKNGADSNEPLCVRDDVAKSFQCLLKSMWENKGLSDNELKAKYWQSCTQVVFEKCAGRAVNYYKDFFYEQCKSTVADSDYRYQKCIDTMGKLGIAGYEAKHFQPTFIKDKFGMNVDKIQKVIFSSGKYDQYQSANYLESVPARQIYAYDIPETTTALDYNPPHTCDLPALSEARTQIGNIIQCWFQPGKDGVKDRCEKKMPTAPLSDKKRDSSQTTCDVVIDKFPWATIDYKDKPVDPPATKPTDAPATQPTQATTPADSGITNFVSSFVLFLNLLLSFIVVGLTM